MRRRAVVVLLLALAPTLIPATASASIRGPCEASLGGQSMAGRQTRRNAVRVPYRQSMQYSGATLDGRVVSAVEVHLGILGFNVRAAREEVDDTSWSSTASVRRYAWAGVGLYRVRGRAFDEAGGIVCAATAYVCVTGRGPFTTAAGLIGIVLFLVAMFLLLGGLLRRRSRGRLASRLGFGGALGGGGGLILLQQSCRAPLTPFNALVAVGGGLLVLSVLGLLFGGKVGPVAPPREPPQPPDQQDGGAVYRFTAWPGSCRACRSHAAHRVYRSPDALAADRAHSGCRCGLSAIPVNEATLVSYFGAARTVYDDRNPVA